MASRSCGQNSTRDWDPMHEDYNYNNYDSQYPDDNTSDLVKLDHSRLYITNIPKALNYEGLRSAFEKYGKLTEVFLSSDPSKRYGMIGFETPAEARHAMMKLNKTEPLRLAINIAHEKKSKGSQNGNTGRGPGACDRASSDTAPRERDHGNRGGDGTRWNNNK